MGNLDIGLVGLVILLVLIAVRVPIGVALCLVSFVGLWAMHGPNMAWGVLNAVPAEFLGNWSLSAIPMFLLMGYLASQSGLTSGLFQTTRILLHRVPGSLACASIFACALFSSASGSSLATAAAMARISVPEMLRAGYQPAMATGTVAVAGTLGSLIPPSILMIVYGIFAGVSIEKLFIGGIVPGILSALVFMALVIVRVLLNPKLAPRSEVKLDTLVRRKALLDILPLPVLILGVMGGIFLGVFTPTEAGAVGAFLATAIALIRRTLSRRVLVTALVETVEGTAAIFLIAVGAALFARFMALSGVPAYLAEHLFIFGTEPIPLILQIAVFYLILGCFLDSIGMILLTMPIVLPLLTAAQMDLVWFGVILIKLLEIGLVTPPVGLNVYVVKKAVGTLVDTGTVFKGVLWFIVADIVNLALIIAFPSLTLYLPSLMK